MKSLTEYILKTGQFDMLDNQVVQHINIHEAFNVKTVYYTFEGMGLFSGCKEIIQYCDKNYSKIFYDNDTVIIKSSDITSGLFFDELRLSFMTDSTHEFYETYQIGFSDDDENDSYENKKWNIKEQRFNFIDINIYNIESAMPDDVLELLTHELTHAYNDYRLHLNDTSLRNVQSSDKFKQELKKISDDIKLKSVFDFKNRDKYTEYLNKDIPFMKNILYYLENTEINAYIAQINSEIKKRKFSSQKEAIDYLNKNSCTYYNYKYLYNLFNDNAFTDSLVDLGFKNSTINKFRKITRHTWNKILNHLSHMFDDMCWIKENALLKIDDVIRPIWER